MPQRHPTSSPHTWYVPPIGSSIRSLNWFLYTRQPFPLDYHQTLLSLLDVISEVYNKISKILGPSPFPHASQHMMGPLGLLSPHPGVSYLFSGPDGTSQTEGEASLWCIAYATVGGGNSSSAGNFVFGSAAGNPAPNWTPALAELILKVDGKFKVGLDHQFLFFSHSTLLSACFFWIENYISAAQRARCICSQRNKR